MTEAEVKVPISVPEENKDTYIDNYLLATKNTGRLMLFAGDQKVEHLNDDFYGAGIAPEDNNPEHLFQIASKANIGVFATQLGLLSKYGGDYPDIPYLIKLNSKTNLIKTTQKDPQSRAWHNVTDVTDFQVTSGLNIVGVGYTIYLGSEYESDMLAEAAELVYAAHYNGLLTVLWIYPRGKAVTNEKDAHLIAGAAGVAASLGSDFVKVNAPQREGMSSAEALKEAVVAAGRTQLVCAGGSNTDPQKFLQDLYDQIHIAGAAGNATGRNIHQKPLDDAIRFCNAISAITLEDKTVEEAVTLLVPQPVQQG